jgi:Big-like domain-containing protein
MSVLFLALLAGCAKKLPPPGGKLDVEPPHLMSLSPDSGAVGVPRRGPFTLEFSENMAHRDPSLWLVLGPYARLGAGHWKAHGVTVDLADSLRADQTYTMVISNAATDARGNRLRPARALIFTTGASFAPGAITGHIEGRGGHYGEGVFVWGYRSDLGHAPDSTSRDFDALAVGGDAGRFALLGLPVPSKWRLYAFYDANHTQSFEPGIDLLNALDSTITLTADAPRADSIRIVSVDPTAAATVQGAVVDSAGIVAVDKAGKSDPKLKIWVEPLDSVVTRKGLTSAVPVTGGAFRFTLPPGRYRLRAFLDNDQNGVFDARREPAGDSKDVVAEPAGLLSDVRLAAPPGVLR